MYALDFVYDGQYLSDYGFIICDFNPTSGFDIASAGSNITFKTVPYNRGKRHGLAGTQYEECIQTTFGICKNPDLFDDMKVSNDEFRDLMRWLNRNEYLRFQVLYEDNGFTESCFYDASFNVSKVKVADVLYGLELTLETNRPFGYGKEVVHRFKIDDTSSKYKLRDLSDEIGYIYPLVQIMCHADGDLSVVNDSTNCNMFFRNCVAKEIITVDGTNHIITTSRTKHDICDDFNYDYLKIGNTFSNRDNYISASLPCEIEIKYCPIIKDAP